MKPKFKIGDYVVFEGAADIAKHLNKRSAEENESRRDRYVPTIYKITDVLVESCYGGTQIHYNMRYFQIDNYNFKVVGNSVEQHNNGLCKAREIELTPYKLDEL